MKSSTKNWILYSVLILGLFLVAYFVINSVSGGTELKTFSEMTDKFINEQIVEFEVQSDKTMVMKDKNNVIYYYQLDSNTYAIFIDNYMDLIKQQKADNIIKDYNLEPVKTLPAWLTWGLPLVVVVGVVLLFWLYASKQMSAGGGSKISSFGKARPKLGKDEKEKVYFSDVAGADEEKEELREVVDFLRDHKKYIALGARIPRGILLVGPPGTGKTLLAKAVAGEAGVPFYSISGSDFVEMYVGVGASRVRDLFDTARKNTASIVFIDEIDAVGRHRGAGLGGGHDEREQTLNQLLVEMDGFGTHEGVIVIAATNRRDILDPALLRPGRFDRQITVHYPDLKGREDILKVHAKGKPFEEKVDLKKVAQATVGFTGADLANLLNEAALLAARKNKSLIGQNDIEEATLRVIVGTSKKSSRRIAEETKITAYHEAGHAVSRYYLDKIDKVTYISIVPTATAGGYTVFTPDTDRYYVSKSQMQEEIVSALGGRVAEMIMFNDLSTGASGDIKSCTNIATNMVTKYGMSNKLGSVVYGSEHAGDEVFLGLEVGNEKTYSEETAAMIDAEVKLIIDDCYAQCEKILREHSDKLTFIAEFLIKNESMDGEQFAAAMAAEEPTFEQIEQIAAERRRISDEENKVREAAEEEARKRDEEEAKRRDKLSDKNSHKNNDSFSHNPQDDADSSDSDNSGSGDSNRPDGDDGE